MRTLVRLISAIALAVAVAVIPAAAASAKKPKAAAWAKQHDLKGAWRAKDADRDGVKNLAEYKLGTDPRKADTDKDGLKDGDELQSANDPLAPDTDGDGIKDGAEHAGVVTAFDGETITIRQFKGATIEATVIDTCGVTADDSSLDDGNDDGFVDSEESDWSADDSADDPTADTSTDDGEIDLGDDDETPCDFEDLEEDAVLTQAELEVRGGVTYLVAVDVV
jgi:thrombospondin type 3 repeat protein